MAINKIKVSNFKSFDELAVDLRPLNIVIGANAAGKSNFLEVFRFVRDVSRHGAENAVSLQGGMEFLANLRIGASRPVAVESSADSHEYLDDLEDWVPVKVSWKLELEAISEAPGFRVLTSELTSRGDIVSSVARDRGGPNYFFQELANDLAIFDLDPKLPKKATPITGKADLEPDGSNLAIVLRNLLQNEESRKQLTLILRDLMPFVVDLKVDRFADKSLLISLEESFATGSYLPASFLSDGTIHLTALILALYFDKAPVVILEEPERNIHPHLISKVAAMLADASQKKQVIVTTHNPELVKHARLEDLLLVRRDAEGFSRISRPAENAQLKVFLENDLGVDELYVQDLLGVGE
jgi:predicted ATPase